MTNTINNVPRELLATALKADASIGASATDLVAGWKAMAELRTLLSAPSPAGVDGLDGVSERIAKVWIGHAHIDDLITIGKEVDAAQAIIDGLRGEVEDLQMELSDTEDRRATAAHNSSAFEGRMGDYQVQNGELQDRCDQQAQRIGELEGLLREAGAAMTGAHDSMFTQCLSNGIKNAWGADVNVSKINDLQGAVRRIDAALSAGKEGE